MKLVMDVILDSMVDRIVDKIVKRLLETSRPDLLQREEGDMSDVCEILITSAILSCARTCIKAFVLRTIVETPCILTSLNFKDPEDTRKIFEMLRYKQMYEIFHDDYFVKEDGADYDSMFKESFLALMNYRIIAAKELTKKEYVPHPDDRKLVLKEVFSLIILSKDQAEYVGQAVYDGLLPYASLG